MHVYACQHTQAPDLLPFREKWEADVGPIDGDSWEQILVASPNCLICLSSNRTYRTALQLHRWPNASYIQGNQINLLLKCPKIGEILEGGGQDYQVYISS